MFEDWPTYAKVIVPLGGAALLTLMYTVIKDLIRVGSQKRQASVEAQRVARETATALEGFYRVLARRIVQIDVTLEEAYRTYALPTGTDYSIPAFAYPDALEWKSLRNNVVVRLQRFPVALEASRHHMFTEWEYASSPDILERVGIECAKLALDADETARFVRDQYGLEPAPREARDAYMPDVIARTIREAQEQQARLASRPAPPVS
jgi:hypothetical protein